MFKCKGSMTKFFFQGMADRIIGMRTALRENLEKKGSPLSWEHITNQVLKSMTSVAFYTSI